MRLFIAIILACAPAITVIAGCGDGPLFGRRTPVERLPFGQRVHVGEDALGCGLCHPYARRSRVAGMPSMQRCVGCHSFVAADKPALREGALPWVPVFRVPDHVIFAHPPHLRAGLSCAECHGARAGERG
jgi:hypothetical protein